MHSLRTQTNKYQFYYLLTLRVNNNKIIMEWKGI